MLSVIIPNYNHGVFLKERIESVINQTERAIEIIILDDNSKNNSQEIIKEFAARDKRIKFEFNLKNSGSVFQQWQKGISQASHDLIWIAESDDSCDNNFLSAIIPYFRKDKKIVLAFADSYIID